jgi:hypothetical protein
LDRLDDLVERLGEHLALEKGVPEPVHKWWIVTNSTMTHMVITDQERCIVIAPTVWNKFIGLPLDQLLETAHAQATAIPGPRPRAPRA